MSCEQIWCHGSLYSASSDTLPKPSLLDMISSTIDLAVGRATSQCQGHSHGNGLDSLLTWPRAGVVTKASGRPTSITYDDIVSRSLMANCQNTASRANRKRKADEQTSTGPMSSVQTSFTYDDIIARSLLASCKKNAMNVDKKRKEEKNECFVAYDCVARALVEYQISPKTSKYQHETAPSKSLKDQNHSSREESNELISRFLEEELKDTKVADKVDESKKIERKQSIVTSQPVELKATQELTSIPDFMNDSICYHKSTHSRLKPRKSLTSRRVKPSTSRLIRKPTMSSHDRKRVKMETKATETETEMEVDSKDAKVLYVSAASQTSRESLAFGETSEDSSVGTSGILQKQGCDSFMERVFDSSEEDSNNPEKWLEVLSQWREKQLQESLSQTPLEKQASEYFRGKSFSREELRKFLRRTRAEQMSRLNSVFQDLHVIEECMDRVNANEALDYVELTKELKASADKLQKGSVTSQ